MGRGKLGCEACWCSNYLATAAAEARVHGGALFLGAGLIFVGGRIFFAALIDGLGVAVALFFANRSDDFRVLLIHFLQREEGGAVFNNARLDEDNEFVSGNGFSGRGEEALDARNFAENGNARFVVLVSLGNESAEDNGFTIGNGDFSEKLFGSNSGDVISIDRDRADDVIVEEGNLHRYFILIVDERDNF